MDRAINTVLLLGGNMGNSVELCHKAVELIGTEIGTITATSALYCSEAWGFEAEQHFVNQAVVASTRLSPTLVLDKALAIEVSLGRTRSGNGYSSRTMDIDIIFYGNQVIDNAPRLIVPHPRMHLRNFVLIPLCDIIPEYVHPVFGKTIRQLLGECTDTSGVWRLQPGDIV